MHREVVSCIFPAWDKMEHNKADATAHETNESVKETDGIGKPLDNFEYGGQALLAKTAANFLLASNTEDPLSDCFGLPCKIVDGCVSESISPLAGVTERADEPGREAKAAKEQSSTNREEAVGRL